MSAGGDMKAVEREVKVRMWQYTGGKKRWGGAAEMNGEGEGWVSGQTY